MTLPIGGQLYLPDTSALVAAWLERYPKDIFPTIWEFIDGLNGRLRVCEEVRNEVNRHIPDFMDWLNDSSVDSSLSLTSLDSQVSEAVERNMRQIANGWPHWRAVHSRDHADPWIIAYAKALGGVVVSEEQEGSNRPKIPDVCRQLSVQHMNLLDLFRAEGFGGV